MLNRCAKRHTIISFSIIMLLGIFACIVSADNTYAVNSETACSLISQEEAEYCIDIDSSFDGSALKNVIVDDSISFRLTIRLKVGDLMENAGTFGIVGEGTDSPTNYYYATNETPVENHLSLMVVHANNGGFFYTVDGALGLFTLVLVDSDGYFLTEYECSIIGSRYATLNTQNYFSCSLPESMDELPTIPKRGAILRLYFSSQVPETRPYVEPEPDPEPVDDETQDDDAEETENVETIDEIAKDTLLLLSGIAGITIMGIGLTRTKRV